MAKVVNIEAREPHTVSEVICVFCTKRWISVRPTRTLLKELYCDDCHNQGCVIETGQPLPQEYIDERLKNG